jgi:acyl-CoA thioester hydrolase
VSTSNARDDLAREFPVTIEVMVSWGEMDAMGHVNNIVYFRYFESARIAYFERVGFLDAMRATGVGPILASTHCRFRIPLTYPDRVLVGASASELKDDRFVMRYRVVSESKNAVAAEGDGLIVSYDYRNERKAPLPPAVRTEIEALESRSRAE